MSETPVFPRQSNKQSLNSDSFDYSQSGFNDWTTTYESFANNGNQNVGPITYRNDTSKLQQTHWGTSNQATDYTTETQASYVPYKIEPPSRQRTRDQLMKSSYTFNDGFPMETRESLSMQKYAQADLSRSTQARSTKELQKSHIMYQQAGKDNWTTTTGSSYTWHPGEIQKAESHLSTDLRSGSGTRDAMSNQSLFNEMQSESQAQFKAPSKERLIEQRESLHTKDLRKTSYQLGDNKGTYETTNKHDFQPMELPKQDYERQKEQKQQLVRSNFEVGNPRAKTDNSSYNETFQPISSSITEEARQQRMHNAQSSLVSHHDYRNCDQVFKSSSQDAYVPFPPQRPQRAVQMNLQQTHVVLGEDKVHDMTTLYSETFTDRTPKRRSQTSLAEEQSANSRMMRNFHTQHHTNVTTIVGLEENKTTNQMAYVPHPECKPREPIRFDEDSIANAMCDPSLIVRESTMKKDYVKLNVKPPAPIINKLQTSHIQFGNTKNDWKTTQNDYFQFKTYKMN